MRRTTFVALTTASAAVLATVGAAGTANAQTRPITPDEAQACAKLPTPAEQQACLLAQSRPEGTPDDAGEAVTQPVGETQERQAETGAIVVTGSRIRRSAFTSPDPITIIDPELEAKAGRIDTADVLQSSPAAAGSFQITSLLSAGGFVTNGGVGAQTLSLRGLGAERTLVLVNGRRAGPAGTRGAVSSFDLNVIPSALVQSVEILKSGASSIYGSDAVAGVVNILTRRATDGIDVRGIVSAPLEGGAETYNVNLTYGKEFSRGHIIGGVDFYRRNELVRGDRDYFLCPEEYVFTPLGERTDIIDPRTGEPACNATFSNGIATNARLIPGSGVLSFSVLQYPTPGNRLGEFLSPFPNTATVQFPSDILPVIQCQPANVFTGAPATPAEIAACRQGTGLFDPISPWNYTQTVFPQIDRRTIWIDASYDLTDDIEVFTELLYNNRKSDSQGFQQLFFQQFSASGGLAARSPAGQCTAARIATNPNCDPTAPGDPLNAGFVGNYVLQPVIGIPNYASTDVNYYRAVGGLRTNLRGALDGWRLDSYVQYSRSDGDETRSRILADAIATQEFRSRLCQPGQVTAVRGVPCMDIDFTSPRIVAGEFTPEERAYLFDTETGRTLYTQWTAEASVSGDLFQLPAGALGVAVGAQYRRDEINDTPGEITLAGNVRSQSTAGITAGHATSHELFGELHAPLLRDLPFIRQLTLSAAGRLVSSYAERADGVSDKDTGNFTYKFGAFWQINDWLRLRGSYGTSYRSPALFEQFLGDQTGFQSQALIDPCVNYGEKVTRGTLSARVGERCAALGLAPDYPGLGSSALISTGGGIGVLDPETSTSKNFSVIVSPGRGLWPGMRFSVAVDYFDIEVNGQLANLGANNIVMACLESNDYPNDPRCDLFERQTDPAQSRFGEILTVRNPYLNINSQRNRGVDLTARVTQDLGRYGNLSLLGQTTWQIEDSFELFQGFESDDNGESSEPIFVGQLQSTWTTGPWSVFYGMNVIGGTSDEQDTRDDNAGRVCFPDAPRIRGTICPVYRLSPTFYHSVSITREFGKRYSFTLGVNNLFDTNPPRISGYSSSISGFGQVPVFGTQYDLIGRRAFASVRAKL